jgi:hypothetical protein
MFFRHFFYLFSLTSHAALFLLSPQIIKLGKTEARRNAFMLCTVHRAINAMVEHYKSVMCPPGAFVNHNKSVNVVVKGYY